MEGNACIGEGFFAFLTFLWIEVDITKKISFAAGGGTPRDDIQYAWRSDCNPRIWALMNKSLCRGPIQSPWLEDNVGSGIGLPMVNVLESTLMWT
jgi:hypothetical protein